MINPTLLGHSCENEKCYLATYGLIFDMYAMGDKFDISGLRQLCCDNFESHYGNYSFSSWEDEILIFKRAYQVSHGYDELRQRIIRQIGAVIDDDGNRANLEKAKNFDSFIDECPEIMGPLFREWLKAVRLNC